MLRTIRFMIAMSVLGISHSAFALNMDCISGKAPGKEYHGSRTALPSLKNRQVIGVWKDIDFNGINVSLDVVNGAFFYVIRDRYCGSGTHGEELRKAGSRYYRRDNPAGDYYEVLADGSLGRFDKQGLIDKLPMSDRLHPI